MRDNYFYYKLITKFINSDYLIKNNNHLFIKELVTCLRQSYFRRVKPVKIEGIQAVKTFFGIALHHLIEELMVKEVNYAKSEVRTELKIPLKDGELVVSGKADLIVVGDKEVIIEVKTVDSIPPKPRDHHVKQLKYYLALFGLDEGILLYFDRVGNINTYVVRKDSKVKQEIIARAKELYYALKHRKPPKPEKTPLCNYCPYKWKCFSN